MQPARRAAQWSSSWSARSSARWGDVSHSGDTDGAVLGRGSPHPIIVRTTWPWYGALRLATVKVMCMIRQRHDMDMLRKHLVAAGCPSQRGGCATRLHVEKQTFPVASAAHLDPHHHAHFFTCHRGSRVHTHMYPHPASSPADIRRRYRRCWSKDEGSDEDGQHSATMMSTTP